MRVLIVDDSDRKRGEILGHLSSLGIPAESIEQADDCITAKKLLSTDRYDLLILDVRIPNRKGRAEHKENSIALLQEIRDGGYLKLPRYVIGITAFEEEFDLISQEFRGFYWDLIQFSVASEKWKAELSNRVSYVRSMLQMESGKNYDVDVCVLAALESPELAEVLKWPCDWGGLEPVADTLFARRGQFFSGKQRFSIAAAACGQMGPVSAAVTALTLIHALRPRFLLMPGICAAAGDEPKYGDVIVASFAWDIDVGKIKDGAVSIEPYQYRLPEWLLANVRKHKAEGNFAFDVIIGGVASSSKVVADKAYRDSVINPQHRRVAGIDMEIAALYASSVCAPHPRPSVLAAKGVCDYATSEKDDRYQKSAARNSADFLYGFLCQQFHSVREKAGSA